MKFVPYVVAVSFSLACNSNAIAQQGYKLGEGAGPISGQAGPDGSSGAAGALEKCPKPLGTLAVVEPQDFGQKFLAQFNLPSPNGLIRLLVQQSNCFQVVERGVAMQNILQERSLAAGGQLQSGSNVGGGQMVTADFLMTPEVNFKENNSGGIGGAAATLGSFFGAAGSIIGAVAGGLKFKQAQTTLILSDTRSGLQVATATGAAEKSDFGIGGLFGGGGAAVGLGAYQNTNEGKVVAAAFLDSYNNLVKSVRDNPNLVQAKAGSAAQANAKNSVQAGFAFNVGDVVYPKIAGVKMHKKADESSPTVARLQKDTEALVSGSEVNGMIEVETADHKGWVAVSRLRK
ncbi:MAG: CsgG/HfaB family protein [Limnobacter sp.]|uniref:CsgG/HfaB family protein n=1 Tax=Limnobacter sp. TaxID=2003368 RepID=UPI003919CA00